MIIRSTKYIILLGSCVTWGLGGASDAVIADITKYATPLDMVRLRRTNSSNSVAITVSNKDVMEQKFQEIEDIVTKEIQKEIQENPDKRRLDIRARGSSMLWAEECVLTFTKFIEMTKGKFSDNEIVTFLSRYVGGFENAQLMLGIICRKYFKKLSENENLLDNMFILTASILSVPGYHFTYIEVLNDQAELFQQSRLQEEKYIIKGILKCLHRSVKYELLNFMTSREYLGFRDINELANLLKEEISLLDEMEEETKSRLDDIYRHKKLDDAIRNARQKYSLNSMD